MANRNTITDRCLLWLVGGILVLFQSVSSYGQTKPPLTLDPGKKITQYMHDSWKVEDGLPQNSIRAITQTRDGYLWLGTEEGLVRFDGVTFDVFDKRTEPAFLEPEVEVLLEDSHSTLWIGTRGGGLISYQSGHFTRYTTDDGLSSNDIMSLFEDQQGRLWIGTYNDGLTRYEEGIFTPFPADGDFSGGGVLAIEQDQRMSILIGSEFGLFVYDGTSFTSFDHSVLSQADIKTLYKDRDGTIWIGTRENGLYVQKQGEITGIPLDEFDGYVFDIVQDAEGFHWIALHGGGLIRHRPDGTREVFNSDLGLSNDVVLSLCEDEEGSLWIGTRIGGLNRLSDGKFTTYSVQEGLVGKNVFPVFEDNLENLWIGTENGLSCISDGLIQSYTKQTGLSSNMVLSLGQRIENELWIGTYDSGINRLFKESFTNYTRNDGVPGNSIWILFTDSRQKLWIGTGTDGVGIFDGESFDTLTTENGLSSNDITSINEGRDGSIWIGTYNSGLNRLKNGTISHITTENGLSDNRIQALYEDDEETLWIGTAEGGLNRYENGTIQSYSSKDGLFDDNIYVILEDDLDYLWMSSNRGIFRVHKNELNDFSDGKISRIKCDVFGTADGMKSAEANGGVQPAGWKSKDGQLWFPTTDGVAMIDPNNIRFNTIPPPVDIKRLEVDNEVISMDGEIVLNPGSDKLEIDYTALSLVAPEKVIFKYKLDGADDEWFDAGTRRTAYYTNLDPGAYTFRVIACNNDGVWNETGTSLAFYLKPFFYQTTWFLVLCFLSLVGAMGLAYIMRIKRMKARERYLETVVDERTRDLRTEKERMEKAKAVIEVQADKLRELDRFKTRFFANISHEFRTPLTMIVGPLENALNGTYGPLSGPLTRQVSTMLRNALRLMRLINQLLDLSKLEAGKMRLRARPRNIVEFLEGIVYSFTAFAEQKELTLTFHSGVKEAMLYFEPDKLEKVFFNLLSNAVKFTPAKGSVKITVKEATVDSSSGMIDGALQIRISDTGIGIPADHIQHIFDRFHQVDGSYTRTHEGTGIGLALVKELVLLHHGTIDASSTLGEGTVFTIVLPKGRSHLREEDLLLEGEGETTSEPGHGAMTEFASGAFDFMQAQETSISGDGYSSGLPDDVPLILIVDDNKEVREYVGSILHDMYRTEFACDGVEGLERTRASLPDLVISDVMMPRMDGNELCKTVKNDPNLNHIPVILLTARATQNSKLEGLTVGADDYMSKPFNARELLASVKNLITLRHQEKELKLLNEDLEKKVKEQLDILLAEREKYEKQLISAKEKAEESARLKSAILDNVNHEIRTPITAITGYAQLLELEVSNTLREFTKHIRENSERLTRTLDGLMELSTLEAEKIGTDLQKVNMLEVTGLVAARYLSQAEDQGLSVHIEYPTGSQIEGYLDPAGIEVILNKLVENAVKFTRRGTICLSLGRLEKQVFVSVRDTGEGMNTDAIPRLFEAFVQESTGLNRSHEGCGLGLTIAKRLTELMNGSITVDTKKGEGSTFTVSFPAYPADRHQDPVEVSVTRVTQ